MKSQFDKEAIKKDFKKLNNKEIKLYELICGIVLSESQVLWQSSQLFLLANTFLAGFIGTNLTTSDTVNSNIGITVLAFMGIIISTLWIISYIRTSTYYKFRIAQAWQREPEGWMLFNGDPRNLAEGSLIEIDKEKFHLPWLSSLKIVLCLIVLFIIFFLAILVIYFPWSITLSPIPLCRSYIYTK